MPITFDCIHCHRQITVPDKYRGQTGKCRHCGGRIVVPEESDMQFVDWTDETEAVSAGGTGEAWKPTPLDPFGPPPTGTAPPKPAD